MNNVMFRCMMSHIISNASFDLENRGKGGRHSDIWLKGALGNECWEPVQ